MYQYEFRTRDELDRFIREEVCTCTEAQEILGLTRQALNSLVGQLKLYPIVSRDQATIFWKSDVLQQIKEPNAKNQL